MGTGQRPIICHVVALCSQSRKELSAAGRCAGMGCALIKQLAAELTSITKHDLIDISCKQTDVSLLCLARKVMIALMNFVTGMLSSANEVHSQLGILTKQGNKNDLGRSIRLVSRPFGLGMPTFQIKKFHEGQVSIK